MALPDVESIPILQSGGEEVAIIPIQSRRRKLQLVLLCALGCVAVMGVEAGAPMKMIRAATWASTLKLWSNSGTITNSGDGNIVGDHNSVESTLQSGGSNANGKSQENAPNQQSHQEAKATKPHQATRRSQAQTIEETPEWQMCTKKAQPGRNAGECGKLNLANRGLQGRIPEAIARIKNLQEVDLSGNNLEGEIPPEIGQSPRFRQLQIFHLNDNQLTGSIPESLGSLTNMQSLSLARNRLTGEVPTAFQANNGIRADIQELDLSGNQLSGPIPVNIGHFDNLNKLDLSNNMFSEGHNLDAHLGQLDNLHFCDVSGNQFDPPATCQG